MLIQYRSESGGRKFVKELGAPVPVQSLSRPLFSSDPFKITFISVRVLQRSAVLGLVKPPLLRVRVEVMILHCFYLFAEKVEAEWETWRDRKQKPSPVSSERVSLVVGHHAWS